MYFSWQLRRILLSATLLVALALPRIAAAIPVTNYWFDLTVDRIDFFTPERLAEICGADPLVTATPSLFVCKPQANSAVPVEIGDHFLGRFQIDTDLTGFVDGFYDIPVKSLSIDIGMLRWDHSTIGSTPNCFASAWQMADCLSGYRGITFAFSEGLGVGIEGGQITSLLANFFSSSDLPNVTFGYDHVGGLDRWFANGRGEIGGTFKVWQVPEPNALALFVLGIAVLALSRMQSRLPVHRVGEGRVHARKSRR